MKLPLEKLHFWKVVTWEIVTWEVALGKMPFGKNIYGKRDLGYTHTSTTKLLILHLPGPFLYLTDANSPRRKVFYLLWTAVDRGLLLPIYIFEFLETFLHILQAMYTMQMTRLDAIFWVNVSVIVHNYSFYPNRVNTTSCIWSISYQIEFNSLNLWRVYN